MSKDNSIDESFVNPQLVKDIKSQFADEYSNLINQIR